MQALLKPLAVAVGLALSAPVMAACGGHVTLGEGDGLITTQVNNKSIHGVCLNDLIVDTATEGANYGNHGEFIADLTKLVSDLAKKRKPSPREAAQLVIAGIKSDVGKTMHVRVIAFNDFHGNIDGANLTLSSSDDGLNRVPAGGVDYMAGLVQQLKAGAPNSVVVSAGDLIGASPLNSALFHDEPTIEAMNRLGLEFNAVGNHEFDEGREELLRMQNGGCHPTDANSCQGNSVGTPFPFEGAKFGFLAANVVDTTSHKTLFPAFGIRNFKGNRIAFIGMTLDTRKRDVVAVSAVNKVVDRNNLLGAAEPIVPVAEISQIVANYNALSKPIANRVIGGISADITRTRTPAGESALGDVIADAQLEATAPADKGGAVIAFMNSGGIRADMTYAGSSAGEGDGNVTYGEAFTVQPFGNSLVVKTLTGQQIYDLLNQQWGANQYADGYRTLQVSQGFTYQHTFQPNASPLGQNYVCDGSVKLNGAAIDKAASYRVTMNSFLATGGDNFTVFNLGTDQLGGDVDVDAMEAYFASHGTVAPGAQDRIVQVANCSY